jgi:hypothetical protein
LYNCTGSHVSLNNATIPTCKPSIDGSREQPTSPGTLAASSASPTTTRHPLRLPLPPTQDHPKFHLQINPPDRVSTFKFLDLLNTRHPHPLFLSLSCICYLQGPSFLQKIYMKASSLADTPLPLPPLLNPPMTNAGIK